MLLLVINIALFFGEGASGHRRKFVTYSESQHSLY